MFQHVAEYNTQMTNILFRLFDLEIRNKHTMKEKEKFVQNLQGILENELKLITKLQVKQNENNEILAQLQIIRQKINNMEKHNKDLEKNIAKKDSLQITLIHTDVNY